MPLPLVRQSIMKKFYGLTGTKLNIAIAVIAGTDFALFGYDQGMSRVSNDRIAFVNDPKGVMGGLLTLQSFLKYFPQIDTVNPPQGSTASHASNLQGKCGFGPFYIIWYHGESCVLIWSRHYGWWLYPWLLLWRRSNYLAGEFSWPEADNFHRFIHNGHWGDDSMLFL